MNFLLDSGREIRMVWLRQSMTYSGFVEGVPSKEINLRLIDGIVEEQTKVAGARPFLIEPVEKVVEYIPGKTFTTIPPVAVVAVFESVKPARDKKMFGSHLTVVWFQEAFALPVDPAVFRQLQAMDWDQSAVDTDNL